MDKRFDNTWLRCKTEKVAALLRTEHRRACGYYLLLALIVLAALWLRTDDLLAWRDQPQRAFHNGQPVLMNFDGYYYLSLARDLQQKTYGREDRLRGVPESPARPMPPPLLSVVTAWLSGLTALSLDWIATLLPALLGVVLAWPLALFGRLYGGRGMALVTVGMSLFATYYVYRTTVGWFDTDCLNVSFVFFICYCFIRFGLIQKARRYGFLAGGAVAFGLFLLWWDQTPAVAALISLLPLIVVAALFYRPSGRERWIAGFVLAACIACLVLWKGSSVLTAPFKAAYDQWFYLAKQPAGDFPNIGASISEQKRASLSELVRISTGNWVSFAAGFIGLGWLFWRKRKAAAPLLVPLGIGLLSLLFARRFLIFLNPFIAMGCGYLVQALWQSRYKNHFCRPLAIVIAGVAVLTPIWKSWSKVYWPKAIPPIVQGMHAASETTPQNAVLWTWWDHGYTMVYWARRATISDGSLHGGLRTVCNALPMAADNERLAANFIHFYVARGLTGFRKVFEASGGAANGLRVVRAVLGSDPQQVRHRIVEAGLFPVETWYDFFFPVPLRDVFLFLDLRQARTAYWWYWFGTWVVEKQDGIHGRFQLFRGCAQSGDTLSGRGITADLTAGTVSLPSGTHKLSAVYLIDGDSRETRWFDAPDGLVLTHTVQARTASLADQNFSRSVFFNLFAQKQSPAGHFSLKAARSPYYQIWHVRAPTYPGS